MKDAARDPAALDVAALCRNAGRIEGKHALVAMQRLVESLAAPTDGSASWHAEGELVPVSGGEPELWLMLSVSAEIPLECQRCLMPVIESLSVERRFRFVRDEDAAARLDEESEDDVLALPGRLDMHGLIEDELILALPIVPRHGTCPQPLPTPADVLEGETPAPHPFAALASLRRPKGAGDES